MARVLVFRRMIESDLTRRNRLIVGCRRSCTVSKNVVDAVDLAVVGVAHHL